MNTIKASPHGTNRKTTASMGKLFILTIGGAIAFWATTIATSLLPIAAEYRGAFSNWSLQTLWVDSLFVGLIIGCGVSYALLRSMDKNPTKNPIQKSTMLGFVALVIATILIDVPRTFLGPKHALYYFFIGVLFNTARFLLLGIVIGYLYKRLYRAA